MQQGFFILWILALGVSMVSWLYLKMVSTREGAFQNRRRITGCELARQALDRTRLHSVAIDLVVKQKRTYSNLHLDRLSLAKKVYYGTKLTELAQALWECGHLLLKSSSLAYFIGGILETKPTRILIAVSWILIFAGFLFPSLRGMATAGQFLFIAIFFLALTVLLGEWEVMDRVVVNLSQSEGLETNEKIRIRRILNAMRWMPLADLCRIKI